MEQNKILQKENMTKKISSNAQFTFVWELTKWNPQGGKIKGGKVAQEANVI